jgi:hypothetical protein
MKDAALTWNGFHPDITVMVAYDSFTDGQPQADASFPGRKKGLEYIPDIFFLDALARIANADDNGFPFITVNLPGL